MTLIAALRCDMLGHPEIADLPTVVICADSQETAGDYRVEVQKIRPIDAGKYELIIGGSGNIAALIDGQSEVIERNVRAWPKGLSEDDAKARLERVLIGYNARQVRNYPISPIVDGKDPEYRVMSFLICLREKGNDHLQSPIYLWKTEGTTVRSVTDYALVGWQEAAYHYQLTWLYKPGMTAFQAALICIHLLKVAEDNLYIGGPTQVIEVNGYGTKVWPAEDVQLLGRRVARFNETLAELVLTFPMLSANDESYAEFLEQLRDTIKDFRGRQMGVTGEGPYGRMALRRSEMWARAAIEREYLRRHLEEQSTQRPPATPSDSETPEGQP